MADTPLFGGVLEKIDRAGEHIQAFRDEVVTLGKLNPYRISYELEDGGRQHIFRIRFNVELPAVQWSLYMGEFLYNLRCALDYSVYLMGIRNTGVNPPPNGERLAFPIVDDPTRFPGPGRFDPIGDLRTNASMVAAIEAVQPYHTPVGHSPPALALLRDLNNADKHRMTSVVAGQTHGTGKIDMGTFAVTGGEPINFSHVRAPLVDGTPLFTIVFAEPKPRNPEINYQLSISPAFRHSPFPDGRTFSDIDWVLPYIRDQFHESHRFRAQACVKGCLDHYPS